MKFAPLFVCAACLHGVTASESGHIRDFRVVISSTPKTDDVHQTFSDGNGRVSGTLAGSGQDENLRYGISFNESFGDVGPFGGLVMGLGFTHSEQKSENEDTSQVVDLNGTFYVLNGSIDQTVNVFDLSLAYAYRIAGGLHTEIGGFSGFGAVTISHRTDIAGGGSSRFRSDPELYYEYGGKAGLYYTFHSRLQLGVEGGWIVSHAEATIKYPLPGGNELHEDDEIEQSGAFAGITLGVNF